jgi:hypothetical protein
MKLRVLYREAGGEGRFTEVEADSNEHAAWQVATKAARTRGAQPEALELVRVEQVEA